VPVGRQSEAIHLRHFQIGYDRIEAASRLPDRQRGFCRSRAGDLISGGLEYGGQHAAKENGIVDEQYVADSILHAALVPALPVIEGKRQEMRDIDDFRCFPSDDCRSKQSRAGAEAFLSVPADSLCALLGSLWSGTTEPRCSPDPDARSVRARSLALAA
jgi:hypothetical protein